MADKKKQRSGGKREAERRNGKDRRVAKVDRRGDERVETELHPRRSGKDRRDS